MQALSSGGLARHQNLMQASTCCSRANAVPAATAPPPRRSSVGGGVATAAAASPALQQQLQLQQPQRRRLAARAALMDPAEASFDSGGQQQPQQPQQQQQPWTYKYRWRPCPSPCAAGDQRCREVEALVQSVLSFPALPVRVCRVLPSLQADVGAMTALVEAMAAHFGKELTLCYVQRQPRLLELDFDAVLRRVAALREVLGVRDSDVPGMLRKCPGLLLLPREALAAAHDNIPRVVRFSAASVRALELKYPVVLTLPPARLRALVERLRQLCYTREEWAREFDGITPSLLAYFLRDATDQLMRLEYLASTGERPEWTLRQVMKPANRSFRTKTRSFAAWEARVKARRAAQQQAAQQAAQQAEASAIKAALEQSQDEEQQELLEEQQEQQQ